MGARVLWAGNTAVHAASCNCIICRADRVKPSLPMARLVPPWWIRVWSAWVIVAFLAVGCRAPIPPQPVISNHVGPAAPITVERIPALEGMNWTDRCYLLDMNPDPQPVCVWEWYNKSVNALYCGCCPAHLPHWLCRRMF